MASPEERAADLRGRIRHHEEQYYVHDAPENPKAYGNHLLLVKAHKAVPIRYFTGAGWNRSGQFTDRASWEAYVRTFAKAAANPLEIAVAKQ